MSLVDPVGGNFRLLGITYDTTLSMSDTIEDTVREAAWKLKTLRRSRRFYTDAELIVLYKAHVLGYLEFRTPAVYHAKREELSKLNAVQTKFLREAGVNEITALRQFNLAPRSLRRDIAMLGVLHRAALGRGPPQLKELFRRSGGGFMLIDPHGRTTMSSLMRQSLWGLVPVYNRLGTRLQSSTSVKAFQSLLQQRAKRLAENGVEDWMRAYSSRP